MDAMREDLGTHALIIASGWGANSQPFGFCVAHDAKYERFPIRMMVFPAPASLPALHH